LAELELKLILTLFRPDRAGKYRDGYQSPGIRETRSVYLTLRNTTRKLGVAPQVFRALECRTSKAPSRARYTLRKSLKLLAIPGHIKRALLRMGK